MISYSIAAAKESGLFERIVVSTDSDEIASVAREAGAEIPFLRPAELADDHAGTDSVFVHALETLYVKSGQACCILATAPFLQSADLKRGFDLLQKSGATSAVSVTTFPYPVLRALQVNAAGRLEMIWPEHRTTRSQDLPEAWHDAGQFYWVDVTKYLREQKLFSADAIPVPLPRNLVQDIDTPKDWENAERMFAAWKASRV